MKFSLKYRLKGCLKRAIARSFLQPIWRLVYKLSLYGLGYRNTERQFNGELRFYRWLIERLSRDSQTEPVVIFDVGARFGEVSALFHEAHGRFHIHAFEPDPRNAAYLRDRFQEKVTVNEVAAAERAGEETLFYLPDAQLSHFSSLVEGTLEAYPGNRGVDRQSVRTISLDGYADEKNIQDIAFLKIDVEGAENRVLEGTRRLLEERRIAWLLVEISRATRISGYCLHDIATLMPNYTCYKVLPTGLVRLDLDRHPVELDIMEYANFVFRRSPSFGITRSREVPSSGSV